MTQRAKLLPQIGDRETFVGAALQPVELFVLRKWGQLDVVAPSQLSLRSDKLNLDATCAMFRRLATS